MAIVMTFENSHVTYRPDTSKHGMPRGNKLKFTIADYINRACKTLSFTLVKGTSFAFNGRRFIWNDSGLAENPPADEVTKIHIKNYLTGLTSIMVSNNRAKEKMVERWVRRRTRGFSVSCGHPCPLRIAVDNDMFETLNFLLENGADPNRYGGNRGSVLYIAACMRKRYQFVDSLFHYGALVEWESEENVQLKRKLLQATSLVVVINLAKTGMLTSRFITRSDPRKLDQIKKWQRKRKTAILNFLDELVGSPHVLKIIMEYETFIGYNYENTSRASLSLDKLLNVN